MMEYKLVSCHYRCCLCITVEFSTVIPHGQGYIDEDCYLGLTVGGGVPETHMRIVLKCASFGSARFPTKIEQYHNFNHNCFHV